MATKVDNYAAGYCDLRDEETGRRWRSACEPTGRNKYENKNLNSGGGDMNEQTYIHPGQELDRRARKFASEQKCSYEHALKFAMSEDKGLANAYVFGERSETRNPGDEIDAEVRAYMARTGEKDYGQALRQVVKQAGEQEAKGQREYDNRVAAYQSEFNISRDEARARVVLHDSAMKPYAAGGLNTALHEVGVLVAGLPRNKDAGVDFEAAARVLNSEADYRALAQKAAGEWLDREARSLINKRGLRNLGGGDYGPMLKEAASQYPEVGALYNGGRVTADALETIYIQLTN